MKKNAAKEKSETAQQKRFAKKALAEAKKVQAKTMSALTTAKVKVPRLQVAQGDKCSGECKICMDAPVQTVFIPCGHMVACLLCSNSFKKKGKKLCPICRTSIKDVVQTYST